MCPAGASASAIPRLIGYGPNKFIGLNCGQLGDRLFSFSQRSDRLVYNEYLISEDRNTMSTISIDTGVTVGRKRIMMTRDLGEGSPTGDLEEVSGDRQIDPVYDGLTMCKGFFNRDWMDCISVCVFDQRALVICTSEKRATPWVFVAEIPAREELFPMARGEANLRISQLAIQVGSSVLTSEDTLYTAHMGGGRFLVCDGGGDSFCEFLVYGNTLRITRLPIKANDGKEWGSNLQEGELGTAYVIGGHSPDIASLKTIYKVTLDPSKPTTKAYSIETCISTGWEGRNCVSSVMLDRTLLLIVGGHHQGWKDTTVICDLQHKKCSMINPEKHRWYHRRQWPAVYSLSDGIVIAGGYSSSYCKDFHYIPFAAFLHSVLPFYVRARILGRIFRPSDQSSELPVEPYSVPVDLIKHAHPASILALSLCPPACL